MSHPAVSFTFDELLAGLEAERVAGYISRKEHGEMVLYNYNQHCTFKKHWTPFTLIARGLVLVPKEKQIVALPFPKFFNYSELGFPTVTLTPDTIITEKLDGSLGVIFEHRGWHVVTRGSFESTQSAWARQWLGKNNILDRLQKGTTYLVEIIYPENRVVVEYDFERLILLGAYSGNGEEILDLSRLNSGLEIVQRHQWGSTEEIVQSCLTLPMTREGFVLREPDGRRIKFKGTAYCAAHKAQAGCTPQHVWKMMRELEDVTAFRMGLPEEFYDEFDKIVRDLICAYHQALAEIDSLYGATQGETSKEIAQSVLSCERKALIFMRRRPRYLDELEERGKVRTTVYNMFKPN